MSKLLLIRLVNYVTNHVVNHVPSYSLRRMWYERVLGIEFGPNAAIHLGCYVWFYGPGQIRRTGVRLGANSRINRDCTLDVREGIHIGDNVSVSAEVLILTTAEQVDGTRSRDERKPVVIGDRVWIGVRAIIMPGVTLGAGSMVAAGSVVTRDVPADTVVFGNPARPVGARPESAVDYTLEGKLPLLE
jgi:maltose O-acetyltransferase